ncbi:MAG TPA: type II toxin-antitoxin system VapC family toxin [Actinomycetota bacterium]
MTEVVLDASVVLKWFTPGEEPGRSEARALRRDYDAGHLTVVVPGLFFLELLNVAGRRWGWDGPALRELADDLDDLLFDTAEPELPSVATWIARGLTAYDAAYVALAEERSISLVTADDGILKLAGTIARPLVPH